MARGDAPETDSEMYRIIDRRIRASDARARARATMARMPAVNAVTIDIVNDSVYASDGRTTRRNIGYLDHTATLDYTAYCDTGDVHGFRAFHGATMARLTAAIAQWYNIHGIR